MKPCDCRDQKDADKIIGIGFNDDKFIHIKPSVVVLEIGYCTLKIPMDTFKKFAEWYLEDQEGENEI